MEIVKCEDNELISECQKIYKIIDAIILTEKNPQNDLKEPSDGYKI